MDHYANLPDNEDNDNGGVHVNSGIPNKAAYLIAKSIGMKKTANIYYRGYKYLNYKTDFKGAALAYVQAATDLYGANSAEVNAVKIAFSTVKVISIPPTVLSTTPTEGATNVAVNSQISIKFSKPIKAGINYSKINIKTSTGSVISVTPSISNNTLTLLHKIDFGNNTNYIVTIPAAAVNDTSGTAFEKQYSFKFTTVKNVPPTVVSTTPTNAETNVAINAPITIKFSEPIVAGTNFSKITVKTSAGSVISVTPTISNNTLILPHNTKFVNSTNYIVTIPAGAVKDTVGGALEKQYSFKFTTAYNK